MGIFGKPLLVHYHIFKNAGTSVEKILSESFAENWAVYDDSPERLRLSTDDIAAFAKANPGVCAIVVRHGFETAGCACSGGQG